MKNYKHMTGIQNITRALCVWIKRCYQYSIKRIYHSFFCHKKNVAKDAVCVVSARKFSCEIFTSYDILILVGFFML